MKNTLIIAALLSFAATLIVGFILLPILKKVMFDQKVREDVPESHKKKNGTPILGGLFFLIGTGFVSLFFMKEYPVTFSVLFVTWCFGLIGFSDDFVKAVLKKPLGMKAWQKFGLQIIITLAFVLYLYLKDYYTFTPYIPFAMGKTAQFGWITVPVAIFIILGTVNGSNFTDGLDGLETTVTAGICCFFIISALLLGSDVCVVEAIFLGGLLGFLMFNVNKAKVFMGDTGSLALGAFVAASAYALHLELYIPIIAFVYFAEVLSVIIQVLYFKATHGKRIFRMAPIHHHFELGGWSEAKVVAVFSTVTVALCAVALLFIE